FKPPKTMAEIGIVQQLSAEIIRQNLALIAAHTNLDSVAGGTNGELADRLGLQAADRRFLRPHAVETSQYKFVVFVPVSHVDALIEAVARAGAGEMGDYSHCTFRAPGTGTFIPLEGADPF